MQQRRFIQCDVFTETPLMGNGLAVVLDGQGLSDQTMQAFAAWTNLSETTYLLPPTDPAADYRIRIFTPTKELRFAGHPTLGSCAAWLHAGGQSKAPGHVVQEGAIGLVTIKLGGALPGFVAPPTHVAPMPPEVARSIGAALGIPAVSVKNTAILDNGSVWHVVELTSAAGVLAVNAADVLGLPGLGVGLLGAAAKDGAAKDGAADYTIRMLSSRSPRQEDPITGALNAAVARWLDGLGRLAGPTLMAQGAMVGRDGQVHLLPDPTGAGQILVAGRSHILIEGTVRL